MPFSIIRQDITKLNVDAIVNAANTSLKVGGGVCGAIFSAAGKEELQKECDRIGYCATGDAVITKGYKLKAKYIIHTVGPVYGQNPDEESQQLYSCYKKSLALAKSKRLKSVAFPVISSGIYAYPRAEAISVATKAIKDFLSENDMNVYLVIYDRDRFQIDESLFSAVESYIDEKTAESVRDSRILSAPSRIVLSDEEIEKVIESKECSLPLQASCSVGNSNPVKKSKRTLQSLFNRKTETFSEMLLRLIDEKGMTDVEVYKRANIDRKLFSKIRKKDYIPRRTTVIALAIGLKLNLDETKDLLGRAGFALSDWNKFDIIIQYFIENEEYDIFEINETLFAFEQQLLGA